MVGPTLRTETCSLILNLLWQRLNLFYAIGSETAFWMSDGFADLLGFGSWHVFLSDTFLLGEMGSDYRTKLAHQRFLFR